MLTEIQLTEWLLENAGAVIRYRTAIEFSANDIKLDPKTLLSELIENSEVKIWLDNLNPDMPFKNNLIHSSFDRQFENAMLKAIRFGLRSGMPQLDEAVSQYITYLKNENGKSEKTRRLFNSIVVASLLLKAGYTDDPIIDFMNRSLDELSEFTKRNRYDIYVENRLDLKGVPKIWRESPVIKPQLTEEYGFCFPLVYDLIGLSGMYKLGDSGINVKIDSVISYIICDNFHKCVPDGYGIIAAGQRKYYSMGWDPKLPGYYDMEQCLINNPHKLLFYADILTGYPLAVESDWYRSVLSFLEQFRTRNGTYIFPKEYIQEKSGYAVQGHHLGLGENRRRKQWCEIESTFIMLMLKKAAKTLNSMRKENTAQTLSDC